MQYAIETLEKERDLLTRALSNWEIEKYPEAKKIRETRLKDIDSALEKLKLDVNKLINDAALEPLYLMRRLRNEHGYFGGTDNGVVIDREIKKYEKL